MGHKSNAKNSSNTSHITRAIHKYGPDIFTIETLADIPHEWLDAAEVAFIAALHATNSLYGYNIRSGGNSYTEWKHTPESLQKMSIASLGREAWNKGISPSKETRLKIAESLRGNIPWNLGVPATEEHKKKLSDAHKGVPLSVEHRRKLAESRRGQKRTPEQCKNISEACMGRTNSEEHKQACRDAVKALWADPMYRENMLKSRREKALAKKEA